MAARKSTAAGIGQVITLILAFLLASVMIFVFGISVGRDLAEQKQRRERPVVRKKVEPAAAADATAEEPTRRPVVEAPVAPRPTRPRLIRPTSTRAAAPTAVHTPLRRSSPTRTRTPKPTRTATVRRRRPTDTVPAAAPAPTARRADARPQSNALWSVQATATNDQVQALVLARGLREKGYEAFTAQANVAGVTWYRVQVGKFSSREEADAMAAKLRREGMEAAFVERLR